MEKNTVIRAITGAEKTRAWSDAPPNEKSRPGKGGSSELVVRPASSSATADTRQQHLDAVGVAFATIVSAEADRVEAYITAGEHFVAAKAAGPHGTFGAWLNDNFDYSEDTAERAMKCWHHRGALREESARVRNFSLRKALDFIAQQKKGLSAPAESKRKPVTKQELKARVAKLEEDNSDLAEKLACKTVAVDALSREAGIDKTSATGLPLYVPAGPPIALVPVTEPPVETEVEQPVETIVEPPCRRAGKASRAERWRAATDQAMQAIEYLIELQGEYSDWSDNLPENLQGSTTADKLQAIADIDLNSALDTVQEAAGADLPLGFGRD
jgi:hypothetical protein